MRPIPSLCLQLSLLLMLSLITIIGIGTVVVGMEPNIELAPRQQTVTEHTEEDQQQQYKVIENVPEKVTEDNNMALALSKTYFWLKMMAQWDCESETLRKKAEQHMKNSAELTKKCYQWKKMAMHVNDYVNYSLENEENESLLVTNYVRPILHVNQGNLLLSSAMEAIKAAYRDLFGWGQGEGLQIEITIANKKTNSSSSRRSAIVRTMASKKLQAKNDKKELKNQKDTKKKYMKEFKEAYLKYNEQMEKFEMNGENLAIVRQFHMKLWNIAQQLGLSWLTICKKAGIEAKSNNGLNTTVETKKEPPLIKVTLNKLNEMQMEEMLGKLFKGLMKQKHPKKEMEQLMVMDPCEKAKLKVWKEQMDKDDQSKVIKKDNAEQSNVINSQIGDQSEIVEICNDDQSKGIKKGNADQSNVINSQILYQSEIVEMDDDEQSEMNKKDNAYPSDVNKNLIAFQSEIVEIADK